jgi:hypothetical protein
LGTAATLTAGTAANNVVQLDGSARLPAVSGANLTGVSTDTSAMENNLAILAFKTQSANNLAKFNLIDQVIDEYKDGTGVTVTTASQVGTTATAGYLATVYAAMGTPAYITGDRRSRITVTNSGWSLTQGTITNILDGTISEVAGTAILGTAYNVTNTGHYFQFDFGSGGEKAVTEAKWYRNSVTTVGNWRWSGSDTAGSGYVNIGDPFLLGGIASGAHPGTPNILTELSSNTTAYRYYRMTGTGSGSTNNNWDSEIEFKEATVTTANNAAGNVISTANTALSAPTTGDICMLIENFAGTATLNTDIKAYVSRNGGTGWDQATLLDKGTWGTNKKILVANNVAFSNSASGTDMRYKIEWANQASGSKETRVHATSLAWA